jgi:PucR family transcriptional regulator, purine catabolism regulatory protein
MGDRRTYTAREFQVAEQSVGEALTIRELVEKSDLQLEVVAGRSGVDQVVEAVYIGDLDDPTPWMVQGSLLLTTQPRLEGDAESGARLVRLLKENRMVGIGVAIMPHVREIPAVMLDAADEAGLPLLRVPEGTPFRQITSYVFNALASRDMHRLRRSVALQKHLLDTMLAEQTPSGLIKRLGELIEADMVLLDGRGSLAGGAVPRGPAAKKLIEEAWAEYERVLGAGVPRSVIVDVGDRQIAFREIRADGQTEQVLMAIYPEGSLISEFADAALSFTQRLLEVELVTGQSASLVRRRTRAGLLDMLLRSRGTQTELAERLLYHGIEPREPWRMIAFTALPSEPETSERRGVAVEVGFAETVTNEFLSTVDHVFEESDVPFVSRSGHGEVLVLSPLHGDTDVNAVRGFLLDALTAAQARLRSARIVAGVSASCSALDGLPRAVGQARIALRHGVARGDTPIMLFDELGVRYKALDSLPDDVLRELREGVVGALAAADAEHDGELLPTLEAYLAESFSVSAAAAVLFVHRNTLRKRLARIESLTHLDLASSGGQAEAYLSVRAAEVLAIREG